MAEFWETLREFRARRKRKREGIGKKEWLEQFNKLLGAVEEEEEEGGKGCLWEEGGIEELDIEIMIEEMQ